MISSYLRKLFLNWIIYYYIIDTLKVKTNPMSYTFLPNVGTAIVFKTLSLIRNVFGYI